MGNSTKKKIEAFACASLVRFSSSTQSSDVGFGRLVVRFLRGSNPGESLVEPEQKIMMIDGL